MNMYSSVCRNLSRGMGLQVENTIIKSGPIHGPKTFSKLTFLIRVSLLRFLERLADA